MIVSDSFVKSVKARDMEFTTNAGEEEEVTDYHTTWSLTIYTLSSVCHSSILFSIHFHKSLTLYFYVLTCLWGVHSFPYISLISALALEQLDTETKVLYVCMYVCMSFSADKENIFNSLKFLFHCFLYSWDLNVWLL